MACLPRCSLATALAEDASAAAAVGDAFVVVAAAVVVVMVGVVAVEEGVRTQSWTVAYPFAVAAADVAWLAACLCCP